MDDIIFENENFKIYKNIHIRDVLNFENNRKFIYQIFLTYLIGIDLRKEYVRGSYHYYDEVLTLTFRDGIEPFRIYFNQEKIQTWKWQKDEMIQLMTDEEADEKYNTFSKEALNVYEYFKRNL